MRSKKWMLVLVAVITGLSVCATAAYAYEETNAFEKLFRGVANIVTSPVEIPRNMYVESQYGGVLSGMTVGLAKGIFQTLVRCGGGVVETLTFPLNFPDEFKDPIIEPEYVWEEWE